MFYIILIWTIANALSKNKLLEYKASEVSTSDNVTNSVAILKYFHGAGQVAHQGE